MNDAATLMHIGGLGLAACCAIALPVWAASVPLRDVSIVDSAWSLLILVPILNVVFVVALLFIPPNAFANNAPSP